MADDGTELIDGLEDEGAAKGGSKLALVAIVVLGIGGGGFVGMSFGGQAVGQILADRAQHAGDSGGDDGHGGGGGHGATDSGRTEIHMVDNLVVNPARSGGSRFLLTSIAIKVHDPDDVDTVVAADVAIRSALLLVLGARTTEELTDIENRSRIVSEIRETVIGILGPNLVADVFVPQFVIQ